MRKQNALTLAALLATMIFTTAPAFAGGCYTRGFSASSCSDDAAFIDGIAQDLVNDCKAGGSIICITTNKSCITDNADDAHGEVTVCGLF